MLQALLPQVREHEGQVEVWVLDNASTDQTPNVLMEAESLGPFRIKRQRENIGPVQNIIDGPQTLATGKYTWILGDHNLMLPNGLKLVMHALINNLEHQVFYVNYRAANYPNDWPNSAHAGFDGNFSYIGDPQAIAGNTAPWTKIISPYNAACTQSYVHIVETQTWKEYWKRQLPRKDFTDAHSTYPHTMMILQQHCHTAVHVIATPCFTIFNGAQSWSDPRTRIKVYFTGLPDLLEHMQRKGIEPRRIIDLQKKFQLPGAETTAKQALRRLGIRNGLIALLSCAGTNQISWIAISRAVASQFFDFSKNARRLFRDKVNDTKKKTLSEIRKTAKETLLSKSRKPSEKIQ